MDPSFVGPVDQSPVAPESPGFFSTLWDDLEKAVALPGQVLDSVSHTVHTADTTVASTGANISRIEDAAGNAATDLETTAHQFLSVGTIVVWAVVAGAAYYLFFTGSGRKLLGSAKVVA